MNDLDERRVRALYEAILKAWNARDAEAMAACFDEDAVMIGFDGSEVRTPPSMVEHLKPIFADHPTATYVARIREVRALGPDVALLRAIAGMAAPGTNEIKPALNTVHSMVARRAVNDWQAALLQSTPAAWHGRPDDVQSITRELSLLLRRGAIVD